jgi:hypothetical protein
MSEQIELKCKVCGAVINKGDKFCYNCGSEIKDSDTYTFKVTDFNIDYSSGILGKTEKEEVESVVTPTKKKFDFAKALGITLEVLSAIGDICEEQCMARDMNAIIDAANKINSTDFGKK